MAINTQSADFLLGKTTPGMHAYNPNLAQGSITGTMSQPPVPVAQPVSQAPTMSNPSAFALAMQSYSQNYQKDNGLMKQRQLLLKHLYDAPLTEEERKTLDPTMLSAVNSGDRDQVDMHLRLVSDEVQGRTKSLDTSIKFLVDTYQKEQDRIETQKANSIKTVQDLVGIYGKAAERMFTPEQKATLKGYGIDFNNMPKTLEERGLELDYLKEQNLNIDTGLFSPNVNTSSPATAQSGYGAEIVKGSGLDPMAKIRDLDDSKLNTLLGQMFPHEQGAGVPFKNPLNLKYSTASASYGAYDSKHKALDGGTFAGFKTESDALNAYKSILKGPGYKDLTIDAAMKRWSNFKPATEAKTDPKADLNGALQVILGSGKFTKDQKSDVVRAINSGQDPFTVIKNQAKNIMGQTEATKLGSYEVAQITLTDIGTQLAEFYRLGGKTSLISGNFEKVANKLGEVKDPKLVTLATQIQGNIQVYRNAISGTAYSEQEGRDIKSIFPGIDKKETLNNAILKGRNTLFDSVIDGMYRTTLGDSYDKIKKASKVTDPTGNSTTGTTNNDPLGLR